MATGIAWRHRRVGVPGADLHTVELGEGAPVVLVPGWPQSWYVWRYVAPLLADERRVVIVEPRGFGESTVLQRDVDVESAAADLVALCGELVGDAPIDIVAHDVGSWISHTIAATHPDRLRSLVLVDAGIPGLTSLPSGIPDNAGNIRSWHFGFNRLPGLPEVLIGGREREFLTWLFRSKSVRSDVFDAEALDEYARVLAAPGAFTAGLEYYRRIFSPDGLAAARTRAERPLPMPILAVGASGGVGASLFEALNTRGPRVQGIVFEDCGHYVPEERPEELAAEIHRFWASLLTTARHSTP
jgi:pimeloyl-ACP methyl ester carboxylesterase